MQESNIIQLILISREDIIFIIPDPLCKLRLISVIAREETIGNKKVYYVDKIEEA